MNDKHLPKYVREKIRKANKGDIYSCYTVGNYYIDEKTLDVDTQKSEHYFSTISNLINNKQLRVKDVSIFDYKRFRKINLRLPNSGTTVIIGNNGAGKTTILEAIAKNLQFLSDNIRIKNNNNFRFSESEINVDSESGYALAECTLELAEKYSFSCSLTKNKENIPRRVSSELEQFKMLGGMFQESDKLKGNSFPYPLLAYYPVERSITVKREEITRKNEKPLKKNILDKIEGLSRSFDGTSNFDTFFSWFKEVDDILNEYRAKNSFSAEEIKIALERAGKDQSIDSILESIQPQNNNIENLDKDNLRQQLEVVKKAITIFLSDIEDIVIKRTPYLDMYIVKDGKELSIFHLSQGEKTLLALVSDIARRLVTLNPMSEQPLHGKGVVIIDELDLHLHPQWQQAVIYNLEDTFPNIQFIVSTHSPLILTTVTSEQIRVLDNDNSKETLLKPEINPYGKISAEALAIMDTPEKPQLKDNIEEMIHKYESLVKEGLEDDSHTIELKLAIESTGYSIDESQLELWRFIALNAEHFNESDGDK
ncbi:AAA family ATPase [Vibrio mediterranei]|nr:AAA family ATPase [Vibrio mediterranei]